MSDTLQDLTGNESGAIVYADGSTLVCNWASMDGIPRQGPFGGVMGLGEDFGKAEPCAVPQCAVGAMIESVADQGLDWVPTDDKLSAIYLPAHDVTVVWSKDWC